LARIEPRRGQRGLVAVDSRRQGRESLRPLRPHHVVSFQQAASQRELVRQRRGTRRRIVLRADDTLRPLHQRVRLGLLGLEGHGGQRLLDPGRQLAHRTRGRLFARRERDRLHRERLSECSSAALRNVRFAR